MELKFDKKYVFIGLGVAVVLAAAVLGVMKGGDLFKGFLTLKTPGNMTDMAGDITLKPVFTKQILDIVPEGSDTTPPSEEEYEDPTDYEPVCPFDDPDSNFYDPNFYIGEAHQFLEPTIEGLMEQYDENSDGKMQFDEFAHLMSMIISKS